MYICTQVQERTRGVVGLNRLFGHQAAKEKPKEVTIQVRSVLSLGCSVDPLRHSYLTLNSQELSADLDSTES